MADKADKPKKAKPKPKKDEKGVLAALPSTRPERIGTRRASAPKTFVRPAAAATPAATKSTTATAQPARAKSATATKKPSTRATAGATTARAASAPTARAAAPPPPTPLEPEPRPRAVSEGAPGMGTSGEREQLSPEHGRPSGTELVTTAVQAAGELTQIGLTIGGRIIKRAVDRLPKP